MPDRFNEFPIEDLIMQDRWRREETAEPFFAEAPPCEYCGHPESECACDDAPDEPVCPALYPQESFGLCKRWTKEKRTIPYFDLWLSPATEQARAAEEMAQAESQPAATLQEMETLVRYMRIKTQHQEAA